VPLALAVAHQHERGHGRRPYPAPAIGINLRAPDLTLVSVPSAGTTPWTGSPGSVGLRARVVRLARPVSTTTRSAPLRVGPRTNRTIARKKDSHAEGSR